MHTDLKKILSNIGVDELLRSYWPNLFEEMDTPACTQELNHVLRLLDREAPSRNIETMVFKKLDPDTSVSEISFSILNSSFIVEAFQSTAVFTASTSTTPIVATSGCLPCVAVGGYDPVNQMAFIVHFSNTRQVSAMGEDLLHTLARLRKKPTDEPIQIHLRGGWQDGSVEMFEHIKKWMTIRCDFSMEIVSEKRNDRKSSLCGQSLSIDSRNGQVMEYDPMLCPNSKKISENLELIALNNAYSGQISIFDYSEK